MDLQQERNSQPIIKSFLSIRLINQVQNKDFQLKKIVIHLNKYIDKIGVNDQLSRLYHSSHQYFIRINILAIFQYFLTHSTNFNQQKEQKIRWLFQKIYEIRQFLDNISDLSESQLQLLDKLLQLINNINSYLSKSLIVKNDQMAHKQIFQNLLENLLAFSRQRSFNNIANHLFEANIFLKIIQLCPQFSSNQIITKQIIEHLQIIEQSKHKINEITKEILLNTYLKAINNIKQYYQYFCQKLSIIIAIFPNDLKLRLLYEANICKIEHFQFIICQNQSDFQLLSLVIVNCCSVAKQNEEKVKLSEIWINNIYSLLQNQIEINISQIINDFEDQILIIIYFKINQLVQLSKNQIQKRNRIIQIWSLYLLNDKIHTVVKNNKSIMINVQVMVFQLQREILGIIPFSVHTNLYKIIITIFTKYYTIILKQEECKQQNKQIILFIIQHFPQFLNQSIIMKTHQPMQNTNIINFNNYHDDYIGLLATKCIYKLNLGVFLSTLDKRVSRILLKYLIENNVVSLVSLLAQDDIIIFTIQNDIELHLDKYEHILQNKIYQNINKYLALVSNRQQKNRYRIQIITCLLNLLLNQGESSNTKTIKVDNKSLSYIISNLDLLLQTAEQQMVRPQQLFNCLFCLATRSLYYNIPLTVHYFIISILSLKNNIFLIFLQKELTLLRQLIKFCKMHNSQRSYQLIGFASIFLIIHGLPNYSPQMSNEINQILSNNSYFLINITQIFDNEIQSINQIINFEEISLNNWQLWKKVFTKCLNVCLIRHLLFTICCSYQNYSQIKQMNSIIQQLLNNQVVQIKNKLDSSAGLDKKRRITWENIQENFNNQNKQPAINWLQSLLNNIILYDQFQQYGQLQRKIGLNNNYNRSKFARIHGKVRTILHIAK